MSWVRIASSALILIVILFTGCSAGTDSPQIAESQRETTKPTPVLTIEAKVDEPTPVSTIGTKVDEPTPTGQSAPPTPVGSTPTESPSMATHGAPYDGLLSLDKINEFINCAMGRGSKCTMEPAIERGLFETGKIGRAHV